MNDLVTREHDKFSNKTITETIKLEVFTHNDYFGHPHYFSINLRHVSTPELQTVVMDIDSIFTHSAIGGDLILLINGTKKISLEPHDQWRTSDPIGNGKDSSYAKYYILSKENLRLLCEAKTIDYQFSSYNNHFSSSFNISVRTTSALFILSISIL